MSQAILSFLPAQILSRFQKDNDSVKISDVANNLTEAKINKEYTIKNVASTDQETINFLFTLGCFKGEPITLISVLSETYVITIKDARYSIDAELAKAVVLLNK